ncbi:MAG TPA: hypothetical protein VJ910_07260, partial [Desulfuromonadales bacterium]|nr:hypothetical protein [Desulfuromonadales bacterium]
MQILKQTALLLGSLLLLAGCVSQGVHQQQLDENAHLQEVIKSLKADYEALLRDKQQVISRNQELNNQLLETIKRNGLLQQDLDR